MKRTPLSLLLTGILSLSSCYHYPEFSTVRENISQKPPIATWYGYSINSSGERKDSDGTKVIWRTRNIVSYSTGKEIVTGYIEECKRLDEEDVWHVCSHNLSEKFILQELKKHNPEFRELSELVEKDLLDQAEVIEFPDGKVEYNPRD